MARLARAYLRFYENRSHEIARNGERLVVDCLSATDPECIFDVGANVGDWTMMAKGLCPGARFHSFEVVEQTAKQLASRFADDPQVSTVPTGLGRNSSPVTIKYFPEFPVGSGIAYEHGLRRFDLLTCPVQRGDAYCADRGIERIDLLKLDVEGMEYDVLLGFGEMFDNGSIGAVQFEYGPANILTRALLRDFYEFFTERDYVVGKLFPRWVEFRPYRVLDEDFQGPNFLAVHRDQAELIRGLRSKF